MPFELGLAMAIRLRKPKGHQIATLESTRHRLAQSLSDLSGYDPYIHRGHAEGVLESILDLFTNIDDAPLNDLGDLRWVYRELKRFRRDSLSTPDIFRARPFANLVLAARSLVDARAISNRRQ